MAGPKDVTVPPPRRRSEDRLPSPPPVPSSDKPEHDRELFLSKLRDVQTQFRNEVRAVEERAQTTISELADVFERQIAERDAKIERQEDTIRRLMKSDTDALVEQQTLHEAVAAMGRRLSSELATSVAAEVGRQLQARAAAEGAEAGESAGKAAGGVAGKRWAGAGAFVGTVIATLLASGVHRSCSAQEDKPLKPAVQQPATGPGYGQRP